MRVVVMGAGALGSYYGGRLAQGGARVTLIGRGEHLRAMQRNGLVLATDESEARITELVAVSDPDQAGPADLVLLTVKAYGLPAALHSLKPLLQEGTIILPLLNGVDIPERIRAGLPGKLPAVTVLGGLSYAAAGLDGPGRVRRRGATELLLYGPWNGCPFGNQQALEDLFSRAGPTAECTLEIQRYVWSKFMRVCGTQGLCCVTRSPVGPLVRDKTLRAVYIACLREIETLARANGVDLPVDIVEEVLAQADRIAPENKPSMLQDLERGKPLELDSIFGTAVRLSAKLGVPTPIIGQIHAALKLHGEGISAPAQSGS